MHTEKLIEELRDALDYINSDGISPQHRKTLRRAVEGALLDNLDDFFKAITRVNSSQNPEALADGDGED